MNWLRTSLPRMAEVVAPLRLFLEELMAGAARRTKRVAKTALFLPPRGRRASSRFRRLEHFLWNGVHFFTDHRNLAYILTLKRA